MRVDSSLSESQRAAAIVLFESGLSWNAAAKRLQVGASALSRLYERWQVRGDGALVSKPTRRSFSFEFKLDVVRRFLAGETGVDLAREFDLSSPKLVQVWARKYRDEGEDGLRPKPVGRPSKPGAAPVEVSELERLRRDNERLRAEVAYLGKLRALRAQERR
ncbi:helix-turn-helix domain-containing protein [Kribbella antibiotica]|uniref:helix-turn-helix domain-containing protein n=1 Tax=Kribbella antibiotica TaxID=190195 RepID=UPI001EDD6106|nr:helix-turn-helix domain-containing protein [Kribbella antibiotica]